MYSDEFLACYVHITIKYQKFRKTETKNMRAKAVSFYQYRPEIEALLKNGSTIKIMDNLESKDIKPIKPKNQWIQTHWFF